MRLNVGDVFEFSINKNSYSYGQIVNIPNKESITVIIFESQFKERLLLDDVVKNDILLIGNTFDAKLHHKHWIIIGNTQLNITNIKLPYYKIGTKPIYIEDFKGNRLRKAKREEIDKLIYRSYVAPVRFESALKAHYRVIEWKDEFDELLYSKAVESFEMIKKDK